MFSIKSHWNKLVLVQGVDKGIGIDVHGSRVEYNLVDLCKLLQKEEDARSNKNIHLNGPSFNNDSHLKITLSSRPTGLDMRKREFTVD